MDDGWMDGWIVGMMVRWMDGWMMVRWMDGWMDPLKLVSIMSVMPSSHLVLCRPLLLLPPVPSQHQSLFQ